MTRRSALVAPVLFTLLLVAASLAFLPRGAGAQLPGACCVITAIDAASGTVSAKDNATGNVFEFKPRNAAIIGTLRVGQSVQANFARNQVSLDGRTVCCTITRPPAAAAAVDREPSPAREAAPSRRITAASPQLDVARVSTLPQVTYGEPIPDTRARKGGSLLGMEMQTLTARVRGRDVTANLMRLNGRDAIKASGLPDGPRKLLEMHVRKQREHDSQLYIVNPKLAQEWAIAHPGVANIKVKKDEDKDSECGKTSINGYVDCGQDAVDAVQDEYERHRRKAEDWWDESTDKLQKELNEAAGCFVDHTLPGPKVPVKFSIEPSMSVNVEQSGSKGSAKGKVTGTATLGVPMVSDFEARMEFSYIPCLPFVFRPKSLSADGTLTVGEVVSLDVVADGSFDKTFTIPPSGGPQYPLYVIPIVIGDIPVAVLDVSAYIEGDIRIKGEGRATGRLTLTNTNRSTFEFECGGSGCKGKSKGDAPPVTTSESAQIEGQLSAQPGIYAALQLSFDYNVLQGRAGPEPFLLGVANGCGAVSATQQSSGASSVATNHALTADLDWGINLRAEALAGGKRIGDRWETRVMKDRHIWFRDMAPGGSSALVAEVTGPAQTAVAQPTMVTVKMPTCYPYPDKVTYRVTWTGGATPAGPSNCQLSSGTLSCVADPTQPLALSFRWPAAGAQSVSVQLMRDEHRAFTPALAAGQLNISVAGAP